MALQKVFIGFEIQPLFAKVVNSASIEKVRWVRIMQNWGFTWNPLTFPAFLWDYHFSTLLFYPVANETDKIFGGCQVKQIIILIIEILSPSIDKLALFIILSAIQFTLFPFFSGGYDPL